MADIHSFIRLTTTIGLNVKAAPEWLSLDTPKIFYAAIYAHNECSY